MHRLLLGFFETCLYVSSIGLIAVGSGFLALIGIKVYDLLGPPHWRNHLPRAFLPELDLPDVLVQIPLFNENEVALGAIQSAVALNWPRDKLHIQMLDDSTDDTPILIAGVVADLAARGVKIIHVRREDRTGFKAGALEAGLRISNAPLIALLDIDFRPPPHWLRDVVPILIADPDAGFVQSRCEFANYRTNWLTRVQGMMLDAHFVVEQAGRFRGGWLFQFNGTGGVWRRTAIAEAGGWSADSISEDLDLTVRVALAGWHGLFVMEPAIPGLVPERIDHWRVQQRRWSTGFVQVARKLLGKIWSVPWSLGFKLSASFLIFVQAFYPCAAIASVSLVACILLRTGNAMPYVPLLSLIGVLIVIIAVGLTLVPYVTLKRGPLWRYIATVLLVPPAMVFISLSNAPAIVKTMFGANESFKRTPKSAKAVGESSGRD
ncbi:glycosyltransferase family 2 protein [Beijerinckia sp. L45]|uniref:glycosyltransferase family 2 protein n=1 Tax=Beijerinckia sp. L45 TaxID=1641855 RepID=UPI0034CF00C3